MSVVVNEDLNFKSIDIQKVFFLNIFFIISKILLVCCELKADFFPEHLKRNIKSSSFSHLFAISNYLKGNVRKLGGKLRQKHNYFTAIATSPKELFFFPSFSSARNQILMELISAGVNFTIILRGAFMHADLKSAKR